MSGIKRWDINCQDAEIQEWDKGGYVRYDDYKQLESELSATQQKLEAAEARIKASHEHGPFGYLDMQGRMPDFHFKENSHLNMLKVYDAPVIPLDVQEVMDELLETSDKLEESQRENAELTRKLAEQTAFADKYAREVLELTKLLAEENNLKNLYRGELEQTADQRDELTKLLAETKSKAVPEAVAAFIADWSSQDKYGLTQHDQGVRWACVEIGEMLAAAPQQKQTEVQMNKEEVEKIAKPRQWNGGLVEGWTFNTIEQLISFANACEKIGMEKAAKICNSVEYEFKPGHECAEAIRAHKE